jgi:glycosyltransferase involved in cell wall biosynthesis
MKILYTTGKYSPLEHDDGSGTDFRLFHAIQDQGVDLEYVGPFKDVASFPEKVYRKIHSMFTSKRPAKYSESMLREGSAKLSEAVQRFNPDAIFSKNLACMVRYRTNLPFVYMVDSTVAAFNRDWPTFSRLENWRMIRWEQHVVNQATRIITRSDWTKESLVKDYGYPEEKIHIVYNASSLPTAVIPANPVFDRVDFSPVRLLFVGRVQNLKGIDVAIDVINQLNEAGIPAELRVVGTTGQDQPHVHYTGLFKKSIPEQLQEYAGQYLWPHFLIHPARYDAAPIVTAEAAAFGVPTLTNAVGGIASTVKNGISGVVLPAGSPASEYVKVIRHYYDNPTEYLALRRSTRDRYDWELNWESAGKKVVEVIRQAVEEKQAITAKYTEVNS